ncbi:NAD(P)-binding protein [Auricularia subglabra TFB-10046 SS5]|uniref:NAD(P)-binding protein n=1 Tax=Auricularia subglabra (strain TFB-10046 / SS5) TaxID=717982 RepID=J0CY89_AURST|nr:NAD(P)-binding protein [Auricularia subglabra TFB-10046 SS5]
MSATHSNFHQATTGDEVVAAFADRVKGRVFVVTGPSPTGIGASTLTSLAQGHPAALVLAGRTPSKFQSVVDEIKAIDANIKVVSVTLDLASIASTRAAAHAILEHPDIPRVDVLINNAGIMATPFALTADGIESQFHADHVGHFLLTNLLLPKLRAAPAPVIVNLTSSGHRFGWGDFEDYNFERRPYNGWDATRDFEAVDFQKNLAQGCSTTLVAALDPAVPNGAYLNDCQVYAPSPESVDLKKAEALWALSDKLVGESFE